jgi:catechol 2,3-dioxygenase-like lactoylglutathione lyase family enzyme
MITGINHITLAVTDIGRSFAFYKDVLELTPLCRWHKGAYFLAGENWFCLNVDSKRQSNACYTHYAFSVKEADFSRMCQRIKASGATLFKDNTSPLDSLYFLDPDHHKLEIHVGNWQQRIAIKKQNQAVWQEVQWFV